jgi:hypothetical protein
MDIRDAVHFFAKKKGVKPEFDLVGYETTQRYEDEPMRWCTVAPYAMLVWTSGGGLCLLYSRNKFLALKRVLRGLPEIKADLIRAKKCTELPNRPKDIYLAAGGY